MKKQKEFHGVIIPLITPFTKDCRIDQQAVSRLINYILKADTIPFILGTTGESASMSTKMCLEFVQQVVDEVKGKSIIYAGISDTCVENSVEKAKKYCDMGVGVFVAHIPAYYPLTPEQILRYFENLADAIPAPLIIYNIPSTTKLSIPIDIVEKLSEHTNIIGLKDSERSLDRMTILTDKFASRMDFSIISGWTLQSCYALTLGFDGIVPNTGNLLPHIFTALYKAVMEGKKEKAEEIQKKIEPIAEFHLKDLPFSHMIPTLKMMMNEIGLCGPTVLPPLTRLGDEKESQIKKMMKKFDFSEVEKFIG
jgi:dihydrodipicolinate synthase/N-acetylneuraminate lyase